MMRYAKLVHLGFCVLSALSGCKSIGPGQVPQDRFDYSAGIGESWKSQTLLNIVKIRYVDPPIFVDVGQIVASRSLAQNVSASANVPAYNGGPNANIAGTFGLSGSGTYIDQPTVTYTPLTGNRFIKSLMTPLTPEAVFGMVQGGWPADGVLYMAAASINGLKNQETSLTGTTPPDPDFLKALALMRKIQLSGGVAVRVQQDEQKHVSTLLSFRRQDIAPEVVADSRELRRLLKLDPEATEFQLVRAATAINNKEVALNMRSVLQLMNAMAAHVEVPAEHLAEHSAAPGWEGVTGPGKEMRMIEIHSSRARPDHAFVAVPYNNYWFWIDTRDLKSKRVFLFTMMMFTLADTSDAPPPPTLTIPTR
jgi:hypothetical protein